MHPLTLHILNCIKLCKQAPGPSYLKAGKHVPSLSLSADGNTCLKDALDAKREMSPQDKFFPHFRIFVFSTSLLLEEEVLAMQNPL